MNFEDAIQAHINWKLRLRQLIEGTGHENIDLKVLTTDNACALGKWIYGEGAQYSKLPIYQDLKIAHAQFHTMAAEVARKALAGDTNVALDMIDAGGDFASLSLKVIALIRRIQKEAA